MGENSEVSFSGQQEGERVISTVVPHKFSLIVNYLKFIVISVVLLVGFISLKEISSLFVTVGVIISILVLVLGILICRLLYLKTITYITDRRIVRFKPSNVFVVTNRSLTWDNVLKTKTFPPNLIWRILNIGNVVVHSKTTSTGDNDPKQILIGNDDILLKDVYFYKDLGNYIEKITYTYTNNPSELENMRSFVVKKKGQRY